MWFRVLKLTSVRTVVSPCRVRHLAETIENQLSHQLDDIPHAGYGGHGLYWHVVTTNSNAHEISHFLKEKHNLWIESPRSFLLLITPPPDTNPDDVVQGINLLADAIRNTR